MGRTGARRCPLAPQVPPRQRLGVLPREENRAALQCPSCLPSLAPGPRPSSRTLLKTEGQSCEKTGLRKRGVQCGSPGAPEDTGFSRQRMSMLMRCCSARAGRGKCVHMPLPRGTFGLSREAGPVRGFRRLHSPEAALHSRNHASTNSHPTAMLRLCPTNLVTLITPTIQYHDEELTGLAVSYRFEP